MLVGAVLLSAVSRKSSNPISAKRIRLFLHPEDDAKGSGYQLLQSKIAAASRRFWGKVLATESESTGYIRPVSDFIMSAWAEEQGFKGVFLALGL